MSEAFDMISWDSPDEDKGLSSISSAVISTEARCLMNADRSNARNIADSIGARMNAPVMSWPTGSHTSMMPMIARSPVAAMLNSKLSLNLKSSLSMKVAVTHPVFAS
jgi:hypothetical protein